MTVVAPAAPAVVWERWTDFASWPDWNPHCITAGLKGPLAAGTTLELNLRDTRGRGFWTRPALSAVEPGRAVTWVARGLGLRARTATTLAPEPDGTRVTIEVGAEGPLAFAFQIGVSDRTQALMYVGMLDALTDTVRR